MRALQPGFVPLRCSICEACMWSGRCSRCSTCYRKGACDDRLLEELCILDRSGAARCALQMCRMSNTVAFRYVSDGSSLPWGVVHCMM